MYCRQDLDADNSHVAINECILSAKVSRCQRWYWAVSFIAAGCVWLASYDFLL